MDLEGTRPTIDRDLGEIGDRSQRRGMPCNERESFASREKAERRCARTEEKSPTETKRKWKGNQVREEKKNPTWKKKRDYLGLIGGRNIVSSQFCGKGKNCIG